MSMTDGQEHAIEQLREVEAAAGGFMKLLSIKGPEKQGGDLWVEISILCADLERAPDGLPLEDREAIRVRIPADFPFRYPSAFAAHERFAGFPHVHWKHWLCLYQAPAIEWDPGDAMFGFLDRLDYWLRQGALGQLDPVGAPLHPPITYYTDDPLRTVVTRQNAPEVTTGVWLGAAHLRVVSDSRVDLVGWSPRDDTEVPPNIAAAVLLSEPFPYEFPTNVGDLILALEQRGVKKDRFLETLQWAVSNNGEESPLHVVIGTPMRGVRGGTLRQHLSVWHVEPLYAWGLKTASDRHSADEATREFGERVDRLVQSWAKAAKVDWCIVHEDRPEIVVRRDHASPLSWFAGKTVALWGCGALGGHVAEYLVRAAVGKLVLRDQGIVNPGVIVRQPYDDADIGRFKAHALRDRLLRIRPDLEVETSVADIIRDPLRQGDWVKGAEVVIDATASTPVAGLLELRRWVDKVGPVPVVSLAVGHRADRGMVTVSRPAHSGGPHDVNRRMKLEAGRGTELQGFLHEFWSSERRSFFQPEPGCSDATFIGSAADVAGLAAVMLNLAAADLGAAPPGSTASGHFVSSPLARAGGTFASFSWGADLISHDLHAGYEVRISPAAWDEIGRWIVKSRDERGPEVETGGLLFGQREESAGVIWVSEVSGPPPDSSATAEEFICGVEGTAEMNAEKRARSRGSIHYIGMWHTHPSSLPVPSSVDWGGMKRLLAATGGATRALMLIVGCPHDMPMLGTYVFKKSDFMQPEGTVAFRPCVVKTATWER